MPLTVPDPSLPHLPVQAPTLGFLLRELYGRMQQRVYDAVAAAGHAGIRPMHSPVLRHLPAEGGRVSEIARETGLAKQSVTYIVEDLVALGYLRTEPDPDDGRARRLRFTARGHKLLGALVSASHEAESSLASVLGKDRLRSLRDMLEVALSEAPPPLAGRTVPPVPRAARAPEAASGVQKARPR
jgi:DNA-binding MarR family transcriptional regulator